jgi:hypothetical protein
MIFDSHLLQNIAFSAMLPGGIIAVGFILNTLLGLKMGWIRLDKPFNLAAASKFSLTIIILLLGAVMGVLFQETLFFNFLLAQGGLEYFVIPYFFFLSAYTLIKRFFGKKVGSSFGLGALVGCACAASIFLFLGVGLGIIVWKNSATRSYVDRAVPVLDEIKAQKGAYPLTLPVSLLGEPPSLLRNFGEYSSDGNEFRFEYVDNPAGWAGGSDDYEFDSSTRHWTNK